MTEVPRALGRLGDGDQGITNPCVVFNPLNNLSYYGLATTPLPRRLACVLPCPNIQGERSASCSDILNDD
jgi:hypothetical protein